MSRSRVHWLAGPVAYKMVEGGTYPDRKVSVAKWEFVGLTASGEFRRWRLTFSMETRKFSSSSLNVNEWERAHSKELAGIYRPQAVLRTDLPKGGIAAAMRAMISARDLAAVTGLAITNGRRGHG